MNYLNNSTKIKISIVFLGIFLVFVSIFEFHIERLKASKKIEEVELLNKDIITMIGNDSILPVSSPSDPEPVVVKKMNVIMTAYSSTVSQTDSTPFVTASNTYVRDGIIANNYLPFGTKVRFPELYGDKIFVVEDRMNRKKSYNQVDIWFESYIDAKLFGVKNTYMEVLEG